MTPAQREGPRPCAPPTPAQGQGAGGQELGQSWGWGLPGPGKSGEPARMACLASVKKLGLGCGQWGSTDGILQNNNLY